AARALDGLDGVVAVAGRSMVGTITTGTPARSRELIDLNLVAPLATVRYAGERFPATGPRDVGFGGSAGAITPMPGGGVCAATKGGVRAVCDAMRVELAPAGVNVSLVMPGMFETEGLTLEGVVFDGEVPDVDTPVFVPGAGPAPPEPLGEAIAYMIGLPE